LNRTPLIGLSTRAIANPGEVNAFRYWNTHSSQFQQSPGREWRRLHRRFAPKDRCIEPGALELPAAAGIPEGIGAETHAQRAGD
jgi:hypothetical protein